MNNILKWIINWVVSIVMIVVTMIVVDLILGGFDKWKVKRANKKIKKGDFKWKDVEMK